MSNLRVVEKRVVEGLWVVTTLSELEVDDVFRMFEKAGEPVEGLWIVRETPIQFEGVWGVIAEPLGEDQ